MPKCSNCEKIQGRLNRGGLCKACFLMDNGNTSNSQDNVSLNSKNSSIHKSASSPLSFHANVVEMVNKLMQQERKMSDDLSTILKEHISYLRSDLMQKNELIKLLMADNTKGSHDSH